MRTLSLPQPFVGRIGFAAVVLSTAAAFSPRPSSAVPATRPVSPSTATPATRPADLDGDWAAMRPIVPRGYACARAASPITIDGRGDEPSWAAAAWTDDFVDLRGTGPAPRHPTRAKLLWDDAAMYVFAELAEPHVRATITERDAAIWHDDAFELFLDPDGDRQNYYEFGVNALNATSERSLSKPYRDGGTAKVPTNLPGLRSAVAVDGTLNDPAGPPDRGWSVELAIPWAALRPFAGGRPCPPTDGQQWRADLCRVAHPADVTDGKEYGKPPANGPPAEFSAWSPTGVFDTHRPERWGLVQFSSSPATATVRPDPLAAGRDATMDVYYRQRAFKRRAGRYAGSAAELGLDPVPAATAAPAATSRPTVSLDVRTTAGGGYVADARATLTDGTVRTVRLSDGSKLFEIPDHRP